jgi:hypothetical protein
MWFSGRVDALQYALGRWEALSRYVEDGRLSIDNNIAERLLRGIAVTRKNYLFLGPDAGGERAAIIYTLAEAAKLNGLDPEAYIAAVLDRLARGHRPPRRSAALEHPSGAGGVIDHPDQVDRLLTRILPAAAGSTGASTRPAARWVNDLGFPIADRAGVCGAWPASRAWQVAVPVRRASGSSCWVS